MLLSTLLITEQAVQPATEHLGKVEQLIQKLLDWGLNAGGHLLGAILIFIIGRFLISFLNRMLARILAKRRVDAGIQSFTKSLVNILLTVLLIVAIVNKLGVETTSFAALLASAGVAVGMALSGNLQNFAGGLIVLLFRPYKVGDWIESQGESGTVREIQIFHTILTTADNKVVYIPNGALSSGTIVNYSREDTRRVEWVIGVEYGENFDKVEEVTRRLIADDKRILDTPRPLHRPPDLGRQQCQRRNPRMGEKPGLLGRLLRHEQDHLCNLQQGRHRVPVPATYHTPGQRLTNDKPANARNLPQHNFLLMCRRGGYRHSPVILL